METALAWADGARREVLRAAVRLAPMRAVFLSRERRLWLLATTGLASAFVLSLRWPFLSLWLGAALFGVPHVLAGLRHVAIERPLRRSTLGCVGAVALLGAAQVAGWSSRGLWQGTALLVAGAVAGEALAGKASWQRGAVLALVALGLGAALGEPFATLTATSHLHAWCSLVYVAVAAGRRGLRAWGLVAAVLGLSALGLAGGLDAWMPDFPLVPAQAMDSLLSEARGAAFAGVPPVTLKRLVWVYAFGQAAHYGVWLRLMPEVDRPEPVPQPFRRAVARLRADFGRALPWLVVACAVAAPVLVWGGDVARSSYFALVWFHVALEAAALARAVTGGAVPGNRERRQGAPCFTGSPRGPREARETARDLLGSRMAADELSEGDEGRRVQP